MEQLTIIAGIEFGDAFNCVRLGEYFTYATEPYRGANSHHQYIVRKLDEEIAGMANSPEKRALCASREALEKDHNDKTPDELADEDLGCLEEWRTKNRSNVKKLVKLDEDKKKLFFTIWANMSTAESQRARPRNTPLPRSA